MPSIIKERLKKLFTEPTFADSTVESALNIAKRAHKEQIDRDGKPHWIHCIAVAKQLNTKNLQILALLHDVLEDCTDPAIRMEAFNFVYHKIGSGSVLERLTYQKARGETRSQYIQKVCQSQEAIIVKIADIRHNLSRLEPDRTKKRRQYLRELKTLRKILWRHNNVYLNNDKLQADRLANVHFLNVQS